MTYNTIADIVESQSLIRRLHAAIATEGIDPPEGWRYERRWKLAAQPGWGAAWESAIAANIEDPGAEDGVITDAMILAAIQGIIMDEAAIPEQPLPPEPEVPVQPLPEMSQVGTDEEPWVEIVGEMPTMPTPDPEDLPE